MWLPRPGRVHVLLIGTTDGRHGLPQVAGDLAAMRGALTDPASGITDGSRVRTLCAPTGPSVLTAVRAARRRPRPDLLVLYFSGHGYLDPADQSLRLGMADSDCRPDRPDSFGLSYDLLAEELRRTRAGQTVVVLDCCYSGRALYDTPRRENYSVLASVQANRETPQDHGKALSPYTEALVEQLGKPPKGRRTSGVDVALLHERLADRFKFRLLPIGDTDREPTRAEVEALSEEDRQAHSWSPQYSHTGSAVILSRPDGEPPLREPRFRLPGRARSALRATGVRLAAAGLGPLRRRPRGRRPGRRAAVGVAAVLALLAGGLGWWARGGAADAYPCPLPLQLRVLASPESRAAVAQAADAFEGSDLNRRPLGPADHAPAACRRITLSVYAAPANQVQGAFADTTAWSDGAAAVTDGAAAGCTTTLTTPTAAAQAGSCLVPLRDVGPQPDVWIPDSSAELAEVLARQSAPDAPALETLGSVAGSSLVLGVPGPVADALAAAGVQPHGSSWQSILDALPQRPALRLLRPNPATSGTGLLQTVGLYLGYQGRLEQQVTLPDGQARRLEGGFSVPGRPSGDARQLLCELAARPAGQGADSAVLVSEQALRRLDGGAPDLLGCAGGPVVVGAPRLSRYYPAGLPALDHPLVTVAWPHSGDQDRRTAAARLLRQWLLDPAGGGRAWTEQGFDPPVADPGSTATPDAPQVAAALAGYTRARLPGRVLFLLDVSGSMGFGGKLPGAVAALEQALGVLGPQDGYGVWTFPAAQTQGSGHQEPVPLGSTDPAEGGRVLGALKALPLAAQLYEEVSQGLDALRDGAGEQPQLLVVVTDGEIRDQNDPAVQQAAARLTTSAGSGRPKVPVVMVALPGADCAAVLDTVATLSGGRCLAAPADLGGRLAGLVAAVGSGGAR